MPATMPAIAPATVPMPKQKNSYLVFDIETGPLPDDILKQVYTPQTFEEFEASCSKRNWKSETIKEKFIVKKATEWTEFKNRAALSALTGQVLAIGMCGPGGSEVIDGTRPFSQSPQEIEITLLCDFWDLYYDVNQVAIGFNIFGFDLPFLIHRSWFHGIHIAENIFDGRYWAKNFVDLMKVWGLGNYREMVKLDVLCKHFGLKTKTGSGKDFARLWFGTKEEHQQAIDYAKRDVEITRDLAVVMQVIERQQAVE